MKKLLISSAIVSLISTPASAGLIDGWSGEAALTGARTTGNTQTTDVGLQLNLVKEADVWRHKFRGSADYGRTSGVNTKQRFELGYQIERDITDRLYAYGNADYFNDDFGSFDNGIFLGGGVGYKLIRPEPLQWDIESGVGYRRQEDRLEVTTNEIAYRGASHIKYQLNENVSVYNDTELLVSSSDTYVWNEAGITAKLFGNLAARASYRVDHHTDVPLGSVRTDTISRVGVVYTLK